VVAIDLQGRAGAAQWVTKFKLQVSSDGNIYNYALNGQ